MSAVSQMVLLAGRPLTQTVAFTDSAIDTTTQTTYTFTSRAIGAAATGRVIVVAGMSINTANTTLSSATIGGVSATVIGNANANTSNWANTSLCYAVVPTGTTATIALTYSGSNYRMQIAVYALNNLVSATPVASQTVVLNNTAMSLSPTTGVIGVGASSTLFSTNPTYTWTNLTKDLDTAGEATNERYSSASQYNAGGISSVTANASSSSNSSAICATWT